jgi:hypothetical protein
MSADLGPLIDADANTERLDFGSLALIGDHLRSKIRGHLRANLLLYN